MNQVLTEWLLVSGLIQSFTCTCVCTQPESVRVNKPPSQPVALGDTPWLHSSVCPRRGPPPPSSSNYGDHKYAGGQTADTPGSPAPTLCLSLLPHPPRLPATSLLALWRLHRHSSVGPSDSLTTSSLFLLSTTEPKYSHYGLDYPQTDRWLFAVVFYELFGGQ